MGSEDKESTKSRHLFAAALFLGFGAYFAKDVVAAFSTDLKGEFKMNDEDYGKLYSYNGLPDIVMALVGGTIVDSIGAPMAAVVFSVLVATGSLLTALAPRARMAWLLAAGQLAIGISKSSLFTAQKVYLKTTADVSRVAVLFALSFSVGHAGTFASFALSPVIARVHGGYHGALWAAVIVCLASVACALFILFSRSPIKHEDVTSDVVINGTEPMIALQGAEDLSVGVPSVARCCGRAPGCLLLTSRAYLVVLVAMITFYMSFFPFVAFAVGYLEAPPVSVSHGEASVCASILIAASIVLGPLFGLRVDQELTRAPRMIMTNESLESDYESVSQWTPPGSVQIWGLLMATAGFAVLICDPHSWTWGLVLLSLSFAMVPSAVWPTFTVFIPKEVLGLGLGVAHSLSDLGQVLTEIGIGRLLVRGAKYNDTVLPLLLCITVVGVVASFYLVCLLTTPGQRGDNAYLSPPQRLGPYMACRSRTPTPPKSSEGVSELEA